MQDADNQSGETVVKATVGIQEGEVAVRVERRGWI